MTQNVDIPLRVKKSGHSKIIIIPSEIVDIMGLEVGEILDVSIRRVNQPTKKLDAPTTEKGTGTTEFRTPVTDYLGVRSGEYI